MSKWKPIDTFKQSHARVVLKQHYVDVFADGLRVTNCYCSDDGQFLQKYEYITKNGQRRKVYRLIHNVTHWMEIPKDPE